LLIPDGLRWEEKGEVHCTNTMHEVRHRSLRWEFIGLNKATSLFDYFTWLFPMPIIHSIIDNTNTEIRKLSESHGKTNKNELLKLIGIVWPWFWKEKALLPISRTFDARPKILEVY